MSFVLGTTGGKSHLIHAIDTPGHVNFVDEVACAIRLVDGIVLVVDVVEGVSRALSLFYSSYKPDICICRSWSTLRLSLNMLSKRMLKSHLL